MFEAIFVVADTSEVGGVIHTVYAAVYAQFDSQSELSYAIDTSDLRGARTVHPLVGMTDDPASEYGAAIPEDTGSADTATGAAHNARANASSIIRKVLGCSATVPIYIASSEIGQAVGPLP